MMSAERGNQSLDIHRLTSRINAIDGLRAVAVIAVIVYHLEPSLLPGGYTGVDVFFVISGFVVCNSLLKSVNNPLKKYLSEFFAKRLLRIYPPLLFMLLLTVGLYRAFTPPAGLGYTTLPTCRYAMYGLSNFYLAGVNESYFGNSFDFNPFIHTWSLGIEEQFYVIFPLLLFLSFRIKKSLPPVFEMVPLYVFAALSMLSVGWALRQSSLNPVDAFYMLPSRFWELGIGVVLALWSNNHRADGSNGVLKRGVADAFAVFGLFLIGAGYFKNVEPSYEILPVLIAVAGASVCVGAFAFSNDGTFMKSVLGGFLMSWVGRISYSLYLWHWPVIVMMRWTVGLEGWLVFLSAILLTFLLAAASYYLIEGPCRFLHTFVTTNVSLQIKDHHFQDQRPRFSGMIQFPWLVILGGIISLLLALNLFNRIQFGKRFPRSVVASTSWNNPWVIDTPDIVRGLLNTGEPERIWSARRIFVLGDSHAEFYAEMLSMLREDKGVSVYLYGYGGLRIGSLVKRQLENDLEIQKQCLNDIKAFAKPGDVVLLSSLRLQRFCNQDYVVAPEDLLPEGPGTVLEHERLLAVEEGAKLIKELEDLGLVVVLEAPKPIFRTPFFRVADKFNRMNPIGRGGLTMDREFLLRHRANAMKSLEEMVRRFDNTQIWDPFPVLCPDDECSAYDGDLPMFFDGDHLTSYGNRKLYPDFVRALETIWGNGCDKGGPEVAP